MTPMKLVPGTTVICAPWSFGNVVALQREPVDNDAAPPFTVLPTRANEPLPENTLVHFAPSPPLDRSKLSNVSAIAGARNGVSTSLVINPAVGNVVSSRNVPVASGKVCVRLAVNDPETVSLNPPPSNTSCGVNKPALVRLT